MRGRGVSLTTLIRWDTTISFYSVVSFTKLILWWKLHLHVSSFLSKKKSWSPRLNMTTSKSQAFLVLAQTASVELRMLFVREGWMMGASCVYFSVTGVREAKSADISVLLRLFSTRELLPFDSVIHVASFRLCSRTLKLP